MNATLLARDAYGSSNSAIRTPRSDEYTAFSRITAAMKKAETFGETAEALTNNRRLWTTLAADLAGDGNGLPRELRADLLSLAAFTDRHTSKVLRREAGIEVLIDLNTTIMAGLRQQRAPA